MGWEFLTEPNFVHPWFTLAAPLSELDANTKAHVAAASTQPPARAGLCCPKVFWIQCKKYSPCLLRAALTCTVLQDIHIQHSWMLFPEENLYFYSWDIAQNRNLIPTITSDSLHWYLVNAVSALGCSQLSLFCIWGACSILKWILLVSISLGGSGSFPMT